MLNQHSNFQFSRDAKQARQRTNQTSLAAVLAVISVFDLLILPKYFQLAGFPLKVSFFLAPFFILRGLKYRCRRVLALGTYTYFTLALVAAGSAFMVGSTSSMSSTVRMVVLLVISVGFYYAGLFYLFEKPTYLFLVTTGFLILNYSFMLAYKYVPRLVSLYRMDLRSRIYTSRFPGVFIDATVTSTAANILLAICFGMMDKVRTPTRYYVILGGLTLGLHVITVARGGLVGFFAILAITVYRRLKRKRSSEKLTGLVLAAVFSLLLVLSLSSSLLENRYLAEFQRRFSEIVFYNSEMRAESVLLRPVSHFGLAWDRFIRSPFIGSGFDTGSEYPFHYMQIHNDWLQVLAGTGVVGLVIWIIFFSYTIKNSLYLSTIFFFPGMVNTFFFSSDVFPLFMLGLGISVGLARKGSH